MIASFLPDNLIEYGTDIVFIAAFIAAVVYVVKRLYGVLKRAKDEKD